MNHDTYYLFASPAGSEEQTAETVVYAIEGSDIAEALLTKT